LGYKFGAFVPELNARGNLIVTGISVATILLAKTSGDLSFVNAHCVLTVDGFQHKSVVMK
jgi:hypothetical protein